MSIDFGYRVIPIRARGASARVPLRAAAVCVILLAAACVLGVVALALGEYPIAADDVLAVLAGGGEQFHRTVILQWRGPIALAAIVFGALLGVGGAIFQSLTRNPLGSPDVIGFDAGSYTAVVVSILVLGSADYWSLAAAAMVGGLATALTVYALA